MKLLIAKPRGFCAGVERAIETVERALELFGAPIWVKHHIVHNRHVVKRLEALGAIFVEDVNEVPLGERVIYSAHGVSKEVRKDAAKRRLIEIDATCGLVTRIHSAVKRYAEKGYHILLIGHKNHVEIVGICGEAPDQTTVIETKEDVASLSFGAEDKLFYITQTTLSLFDIEEISKALLEKYPQVETLPTSSICYATTNRQLALREISDEVDLVLVVGDVTSSNSNRLKEVAIHKGKRAYLINSAEEIQLEWVKQSKAIGLTAGASTPEEVVQKCIQRLYELGVKESEEIVFTEENVVFQLPKLK